MEKTVAKFWVALAYGVALTHRKVEPYSRVINSVTFSEKFTFEIVTISICNDNKLSVNPPFGL